MTRLSFRSGPSAIFRRIARWALTTCSRHSGCSSSHSAAVAWDRHQSGRRADAHRAAGQAQEFHGRRRCTGAAAAPGRPALGRHFPTGLAGQASCPPTAVCRRTLPAATELPFGCGTNGRENRPGLAARSAAWRALFLTSPSLSVMPPVDAARYRPSAPCGVTGLQAAAGRVPVDAANERPGRWLSLDPDTRPMRHVRTSLDTVARVSGGCSGRFRLFRRGGPMIFAVSIVLFASAPQW